MIADLDDHLRFRTQAPTETATAQVTDGRLGGGAMTKPMKAQHDSAVGPTVMQRWRAARWVVLSLVVIIATRHPDDLPDRAAARRANGCDVHVTRGRTRPGHPAA